ncbi:MAG: alcohol dehydrogenase catalytic domain-containing protein [Pirellulales bacterium]
MRGIAAAPNSLAPRFVDVPEPSSPTAGQVLCRTLELGVCGTDREILHSQQPLAPAGDSFLILGHECLARVEALGPEVTDLAVGDLVVPVVRRAFAGAAHRVDMLDFCQFTERGIVHEHGFSTPFWLDQPHYLFLVPPKLRAHAVLTEPFAVAEKGANEALLLQRARLGEDAWSANPPRVLVTGLGPIGFAAAAVCRCRGWPVTIYGRDAINSSRATLAQDLGANYLPATGDEFEPADVERDGYDLCLECTGSDEVMVAAAHALASRAVMVWLGASRVPQPLSLNVARMMRDGLLRNHLHVGSVNAAPRDFHDALEHLGQLHAGTPQLLDRLITARVPPSEALWHYEHRQPQGIKTVVDFTK